jgi:uncharacterized Fe-S cluster protein YjdI
MTKTYKGADFEVLWHPAQCIHSTVCWKGLRPVFDPFRKPWVVLENGEREQIKTQVLACPSGALKWAETLSSAPNTESTMPESLVHIEPAANGPLLVKGEFLIVHADGRREYRENNTALCRCGASANKPFCDGSHKKIGFQD